MAFSIVLDQPRASYPPGSTLTGQVILQADKDQAIDPVILTFTGRAKVHIAQHEQEHVTEFVNGQSQTRTRDNVRNYYSKGMLFARSFNVMTGDPGQWGAGTYKWPFRVQIPEQVQELDEQTLKNYNAQVFTAEAPWKSSYNNESHMLPDTFEYWKYHHYNTDVHASVRYKLEARLVRPKNSYVLFSGNKDAVLDVIIRSSYRQLPPKPNPVFPHRSHNATIKSMRLLPEHQDGHLSFRQKTHSLLHRSSLPIIAFQIKFVSPDFLNLQENINTPLPFLVSLVRIPLSPQSASKSEYKDNQIPTPEVFLKRLRLRLVALTRVRTSGGMWRRQHDAPATTYIDIYDAKMKDVPGKEHVRIATDGTWMDLGRELGIGLGSITMRPSEDMALVPDFSTFNIWRGYALSWKVELCCCGDKEAIEWETDGRVGDGIQLRLNAGGEQMATAARIAQAQTQGQGQEGASYAGSQGGIYCGQQKQQSVLGANGRHQVSEKYPTYQPPGEPKY